MNKTFDLLQEVSIKKGRQSAIEEMLEVIDKHITSWSGMRYGNPTVMGALVKLRDDIDALKGEQG